MIDSPAESSERAKLISAFTMMRSGHLETGYADDQVQWQCGTKAIDTLTAMLGSTQQDLSRVRLVLDPSQGEWGFMLVERKEAA